MLLDTSGLLCLLHRSEPQHLAALEHYRSATVRVTHSLVLAEFVALCQARRLPRTAVLEFVQALLENPDIEMIWADQNSLQASFALLQSRADKTYSWCDALSFILMRQRNLSDGLTTDRHFEQEGFRRLLG